MRQDKYYGTNIMIIPNDDFLSQYGRPHHLQYRIVCKAKSLAEANRKAYALGLRNNTFDRNCTSETGNKLELDLCDKYDFIINTKGTTIGDNYADIKEALKV